MRADTGRIGPPRDVELVPLLDADDEEVVAMLRAAFGVNVTVESYRWKHRYNPAGQSTGLVARDSQGLLGLRPFMQWVLATGGRLVHAVRPVDTVTAPRARRQGVFTMLTEHVLASIRTDGRFSLVLNTPNANSQPGYIKAGWTLLPPVRHFWHPRLRRSSTGLIEDDQALESIAHRAGNRHLLRTHRTTQWLVWRYDPRSGHSYRAVRLREADEPNGLVYRVEERRGLRLLVVCELEGDHPSRRQLIASAATSEGTHATLTVGGTGAIRHADGPALKRGGSTIAVLPLSAMSPDPTKLSSWSVTLGDLERVL